MDYEHIVQDYKAGNEHAFTQLYALTKDAARSAIYMYVQEPDIIEDLLQDTYMKVINQIQNYTPSNFCNWVYTIAKNTALDYVKLKRTVPMGEFELPDSTKNPCLRYALEHLDSEEREVFLMKVLLGHTTKRIANTLNKKVFEVNGLYSRAKKKLKEMLEG